MSLGYQTGIANGHGHAFKIEHVLSGYSGWQIYYRIDGTLKNSYPTSSTRATDLDVGLESHCSTCTVDGYPNEQLQYRFNSSWYWWSGEDGKQVLDPPMCGHWGSATMWWSGQEASC